MELIWKQPDSFCTLPMSIMYEENRCWICHKSSNQISPESHCRHSQTLNFTVFIWCDCEPVNLWYSMVVLKFFLVWFMKYDNSEVFVRIFGFR